MGLSLKSIDHKGLIDHFSVGSYSGVHVVRRELLVLYAMRVFDEAQTMIDAKAKDDAYRLIETALAYAEVDLPDWESITREAIKGELPNSEGGIGIDYSAFDRDYQRFVETTIALAAPQAAAMVGLYKFVNHSDCGGRHSHGDVVDILQLLDFVEPVFKESGEAEYYRNLHAFFRHTAELKGYVSYA